MRPVVVVTALLCIAAVAVMPRSQPVKLGAVDAATSHQYLTSFVTDCPGHGTPSRGECFGPGQQLELGACLTFRGDRYFNFKFSCAYAVNGSATVKISEYPEIDTYCNGTIYATYSYVSDRCYREASDRTTCFAYMCPPLKL